MDLKQRKRTKGGKKSNHCVDEGKSRVGVVKSEKITESTNLAH